MHREQEMHAVVELSVVVSWCCPRAVVETILVAAIFVVVDEYISLPPACGAVAPVATVTCVTLSRDYCLLHC